MNKQYYRNSTTRKDNNSVTEAHKERLMLVRSQSNKNSLKRPPKSMILGT